MKPKIGDRVSYRRIIYRKETRRGHGWEATDCPGEGVFMGYRYKQSGFMDSDDSESWGGGGTYWAEDGPRTKVALIAKDPWTDPTFVDPEGLEVLPVEGPCFVMPDGKCVSPFACIHGDPLTLEEFAKAVREEVRFNLAVSP